MWLTNYVTKNSKQQPKNEKGNIKSFSQGKAHIDGSRTFQKLSVVAPYGIIYVPAEGQDTAVMSVDGGEVCLGVVNDTDETLSPGEVKIFSAGGASIVLKNDGNVYINGVKFQG